MVSCIYILVQWGEERGDLSFIAQIRPRETIDHVPSHKVQNLNVDFKLEITELPLRERRAESRGETAHRLASRLCMTIHLSILLKFLYFLFFIVIIFESFHF